MQQNEQAQETQDLLPEFNLTPWGLRLRW
jgi:hypothetical protein